MSLPDRSDYEQMLRGEITSEEYVRRLEVRIAERRSDNDFMRRRDRIVAENADVLQRLKDGGD